MNKKRLTAIMMVSAMVLALMGCGNGAAGEGETVAEITQADPSFEYNGKTASFTDDPQTVVDAMKSVAELVDETDSAEGDGKSYEFDKTVNGPGLMIVTSVDGGTESIGSMVVNGEGFKTSKGIGVGSKVADVTAAYGNPSEKNKLSTEEVYAYKCDGFCFSFSIKDGQVYSILYSSSNYHG